ncbi:MAG TPA: hypothetical protein VIY49_21235, partial [Bryobacteraceae bacterium]
GFLHADPVSFVYGLTPLPKPTAPLTRLHYLAYFHRRGCTAPVIDVSFLLPVLELDCENVAPLVGRFLAEPRQFFERVYKKHIQPVSNRFQEELAKALPELPTEERLWRLYFSAGVMTYLMSWSPLLPELSGGLCDATDRQALVERAIAFLAAGFRAPAPAAMEEKTRPAPPVRAGSLVHTGA